MKKKIIVSLTIFALLIFFSLAFYSYSTQGFVYKIAINDIDSIVTQIQSLGPLAAVALFFLVILEVIAAPIPPLILYVVAGIIFGGFFGGIIVLAGNIVGATLAFVFARTIGRDYLKKKIGKENGARFDKITEKYGPLGIFLLRIYPITSSDLVSYLAGLSKIKITHFIIATTLGLIPLVFSQTYLGSDIIKENSFLLTALVSISVAYLLFFVYLMFRIAKKPRKGLKSRNLR